MSSLLALVLSLALVLGLAWGAIVLLRRWQDHSLGGTAGGASGPAGDRRLRFVRALPLGPRDRLVLVEVGEETMLLGVGASGIALLSHWDAAGTPLPPVPPVPPAPVVAAKPTW